MQDTRRAAEVVSGNAEGVKDVVVRGPGGEIELFVAVGEEEGIDFRGQAEEGVGEEFGRLGVGY